MARRPARAARGREGVHPPRRRAREAAAGAPVGPGREGVHLRDRRGERVARGSLPRPLPAPHVPLHVRAGVHGRVPGVLDDRRRLQRLRRPPREPRRRDDGRVAGAARGPPGVQAPHGLDVSVGLVVRKRLQLRLPRLVHGGATARERGRIQLSPDGHDADPRIAQRRADGDRRDDGDRRRGRTRARPRG